MTSRKPRPLTFEADSLTNPWIQYAGWPAFWFGLIICSVQAAISSSLCMYYPQFMTVESVECKAIQGWVPAAQLLISCLVLATVFFLSTALFRRKILHPFYFLGAALLSHTIYFFHFLVNSIYLSLVNPWITMGPESGKLFSESIWNSINFIFVAWFYALLWTCLREIGGLKGYRLGLGFILCVGLSGNLVTVIHWLLNLGPIK